MKKIIIAIDGYSSTGKSTFARKVAASLGYLYLDTGALYRAVTLQMLEKGILGPDKSVDLPALRDELERTDVAFRPTGPGGTCETYLNGRPVEPEIRSLRISDNVSHIAALPCVREYVDRILRRYGQERGVVMDGRDIGTAVFPDAELKIFMTADPEIRARRRQLELEAKGEPAAFEEVLRNLQERDWLDTHRETAPLTRAADAVVLDNSRMTLEEEMDWIHRQIERIYESDH